MKKMIVVMLTILFGILSSSLFAAQEDAEGCKGHPLVPAIQGYHISTCSNYEGNHDIFIEGAGDSMETLQIQGKSQAFLYDPQPELKVKPAEAQVRKDFEQGVIKKGGKLIGQTVGQKWPVYKYVTNGAEAWVVLMITSGQYYDGTYGCRIIEKGK